MSRLLRRLSCPAGPAALIVAIAALVLSFTGLADAARTAVGTVLRPGAVVRLDAKRKVPARVLPTVNRARTADRLGGRRLSALVDGCAPDTVDLGTWCLMASPYGLDPAEAGRNDYFFATQKCVELGGWLPSAGELIGAAPRVRLASTITDGQTTASVDEFPQDGFKDRREMSSTLVTTAAGSSAAGSQGVSDGAKGDPRLDEPDPVPQPSNPAPDTTQYVTVYDNGDKGGFAGSQPVSDPQVFRCAFARSQGAASRAAE